MPSTLRHSPAAERNREPILAALRARLPASGTVLEIASGTGQHIAWFAAALPMLRWQPSDVDASGFASVTGYAAAAGVDNVLAPLHLDVTHHPWPLTSVDAIYCANMIHIAPWEACNGLLTGAGRALSSGSMLHVYGPFLRKDKATVPSNAAFDRSLRDRDERWGIRDLEAVIERAAGAGLDHLDTVEMPANNLFVSFARR
ncbi:MAG: DUF938 domain-containing protein [Pseudomonadota bacterium]